MTVLKQECLFEKKNYYKYALLNQKPITNKPEKIIFWHLNIIVTPRNSK